MTPEGKDKADLTPEEAVDMLWAAIGDRTDWVPGLGEPTGFSAIYLAPENVRGFIFCNYNMRSTWTWQWFVMAKDGTFIASSDEPEETPEAALAVVEKVAVSSVLPEQS